MANGVHCFGSVSRREEDNVLRRALKFEDRGRQKWAWKNQVEEESVKVGLS